MIGVCEPGREDETAWLDATIIRFTPKIILNGYAVRNQPQHAACDRLHQPHPYVKDRRVDFVSKKGGVPFIPRFRDPKGASCAANRRMGPRFLGDDTLSSSLR